MFSCKLDRKPTGVIIMLTQEQRQKIEQNRLAALRRREELAKQRAQATSNPSSHSNPPLTTSNKTNTTNPSTNSTGIHRQPQPNDPSSNQQPKYSFNRLNANAVSNVGQKSNPSNNQLANRPNYNQPPISEPANHRPASYGSNTVTSFPAPSTNQARQPHNQIGSRPSNGQSNSYITPAKRPAGSDNQQADKRLRTGLQATKSPYEQILSKAQSIEIKFYLLNNKEFYIDFQFNQRLKDEVKRLNPVRFDTIRKVWIFKLENYQEVLDKLAAIKLDRLIVKLGEGFPKNVLDILHDSLRYDTIKVDLEAKVNLKNVLKRLFPYQREGVIFGVKREGNGMTRGN